MLGLIKICGLSTPETLEATLEAGVDMVGFVFFDKSPRHISLDTAERLGAQVQGRALKVALSVNASDETLTQIIARLAPDWLQLHGAETPERVRHLKQKFGLPVMKAVGIASVEDLNAAARFQGVADRLLFDAKPPKGAQLPGGNGLAFDWTLLKNTADKTNTMVSGGLDVHNVQSAISISGILGVDVSSGVESVPGVKDINKIQAFVRQARQGFAISAGVSMMQGLQP